MTQPLFDPRRSPLMQTWARVRMARELLEEAAKMVHGLEDGAKVRWEEYDAEHLEDAITNAESDARLLDNILRAYVTRDEA